MNRAARIASVLSFGILCSCTTVRDYPRCYLFRAPESADLSINNRDVDQLLRSAFHVRDFSIGKDTVTVNASLSLHGKLADVWASTGCVNLRRASPELGELNDKWIVASCREYLDALVRKEQSQIPEPPTSIAQRFPNFTCH